MFSIQKQTPKHVYMYMYMMLHVSVIAINKMVAGLVYFTSVLSLFGVVGEDKISGSDFLCDWSVHTAPDMEEICFSLSLLLTIVTSVDCKDMVAPAFSPCDGFVDLKTTSLTGRHCLENPLDVLLLKQS